MQKLDADFKPSLLNTVCFVVDFITYSGGTCLLHKFSMLVGLVSHSCALQDQMQKPDADFKPNLVNTVCFVVNFIIQLSTFACNYQGAPFNTPIKETKGFFNMLRFSYIFCLVIIYDVLGIGTAFSLVSCCASYFATSTYSLCSRHYAAWAANIVVVT